MDNGKQITTILNEYRILKSGVVNDELYDIETEFAKTKKNKSWFVIALIGGLFFITVLGIFVTATIINKHIHSVKVDIKTFDDLNLKRLLDSAERIKSQYNSAINEKNAIERRYTSDLQQLNENSQNDISMIKMQSLRPEEEKIRLNQINRNLAIENAELEDSYNLEISKINKQIDEYKMQMDNFDPNKLKEAQEKQFVVNSHLTRFELEKNELKKQYESQIDELLIRIEKNRLSNSKSLSGRIEEVATSYSERIKLVHEQIEATNAEYERLQKMFNALETWKNKTETVLSQLQNEKDKMLASLKQAETEKEKLQNAVRQIETEKDKALTLLRQAEIERDRTLAALRHDGALLERYQSFFRYVAGQNGDAGYVVDTGTNEQKDILVYIDPVYGINFSNKKAYVFRSGNDYIGTLSISGVSGDLRAKIEDLSVGRNFQINDRILLDMNAQ